MQPKAHHYQLISEVFAAGAAVEAELPAIAGRLGVSVESCRAVLRSAWGQGELQKYHAALRARLVEKKLTAMETLTQAADQAAALLVEAAETARANGNVREMRECATALLAHAGLAPVKRTEKKVLHAVEEITDPVLLAKIIESGEVPLGLLEDKTTH